MTKENIGDVHYRKPGVNRYNPELPISDSAIVMLVLFHAIYE
jgi:hypothetical protein